MSGHTPGPWKLQKHGSMGQGVVMYFVNDTTSIGTSNEADAKLIASAPDLLDALTRIVAAMDDHNGDEIVPAVRAAKIAIAKATGGEV